MKHKEKSTTLYKINGNPVKLKDTKNVRLQRILRRLTTKPVLVSFAEYAIDTVYMICACLGLIPMFTVVVLMDIDLVQSMNGITPIKLFLGAISCVIMEIILCAVRNYILNWDMTYDANDIE